MSRTAVAAAIAELDGVLPRLLPSHEVLVRDVAACGDEVDCDVLYVQGRIDRLHAIRVILDQEGLDAADTLVDVDANWRWLVVPKQLVGAAEALAERDGYGVMELGSGDGRIVRSASPYPGIFGKRYPNLRKAWRGISAW